MSCLHEPFDEAYYLGPERLHSRYEKEAGSGPTYKAVLDMIRDSQSKVWPDFHSGAEPSVAVILFPFLTGMAMSDSWWSQTDLKVLIVGG